MLHNFNNGVWLVLLQPYTICTGIILIGIRKLNQLVWDSSANFLNRWDWNKYQRMVGHPYVIALIRFNQIFKLTLRRLLIHLTCLAQSFYNRRSISLPLRPVSLVLFLSLLFFQPLNTICHCFHPINNINSDVSFIN